MKVLNNVYGSVLVIENEKDKIPFGYLGQIINITKSRYEEAVRYYFETVTSKYPNCYYSTYEHWCEAQLDGCY